MKRKAIYAALLVACVASAAAAQDGQEQLRKKYEAKLEESWFADYGWIADYDEALAAAKESGKPILAYFSRSYSY